MKKSYIRKLDLLWSKTIKERDGYKCRACGKDNCRVEAAHIIGRNCRTHRWNLNNGITLCVKCHQIYDQHLKGSDFIRDEVIGREKYDSLYSQKEVIAKYQDYKEIRKSIVDFKESLTNPL